MSSAPAGSVKRVADLAERAGAGRMPRPGTSSGRPQSAVLVPVPVADSVVGGWRREHDPAAAAGVPSHVTLVVPWVPPPEITGADLAALDDELSNVAAFDFALTGIGWFERRVMWLAPEPAQPFVELTARVSERFGTPPWEGEFDRVVPHLTVAHASDGVELCAIEAAVACRLPVRCRADEVWVMVADGARWSLLHRVGLPAPAR